MKRARRWRRRRACILAFALLAALSPTPAAAQDEAELESLQAAIAERRARVAGYEREEHGLFAALAAGDEAVKTVAREVARAKLAAQQAEARRSASAGQAEAHEARLARTRAAVSRRAVALYKVGGAGPVRLVFAPGTLRERLTRIRALQRMLDHDRALLQRFAAERAALGAARETLQATKQQRDRARAGLERRQRQLEAERRARRQLLTRVRADRDRERALLLELEEAARALEEKLFDLARSPSQRRFGPTPFARLRGELPRPVAGRVRRGFGRVVDEEFRTEIFRRGVDFEVTRGERVFAVAAGLVRFADWFSGYGRMVIIEHGDGFFTVSGHLDALRVQSGERVRAGDAIGAAGETGSLAGPRLYFEIRHGAGAENPEDWLRALP